MDEELEAMLSNLVQRQHPAGLHWHHHLPGRSAAGGPGRRRGRGPPSGAWPGCSAAGAAGRAAAQPVWNLRLPPALTALPAFPGSLPGRCQHPRLRLPQLVGLHRCPCHRHRSWVLPAPGLSAPGMPHRRPCGCWPAAPPECAPWLGQVGEVHLAATSWGPGPCHPAPPPPASPAEWGKRRGAASAWWLAGNTAGGWAPDVALCWPCLELGQWGVLLLCLSGLRLLLLLRWSGSSLLLLDGRQQRVRPCLHPAVSAAAAAAAAAAVSNRLGGAELLGRCLACLQHGASGGCSWRQPEQAGLPGQPGRRGCAHSRSAGWCSAPPGAACSPWWGACSLQSWRGKGARGRGSTEPEGGPPCFELLRLHGGVFLPHCSPAP